MDLLHCEGNEFSFDYADDGTFEVLARNFGWIGVHRQADGEADEEQIILPVDPEPIHYGLPTIDVALFRQQLA